ncbi:MAG TPA: copper chaperone PCu(A)C [Paenirhodobacter sp.]
MRKALLIIAALGLGVPAPFAWGQAASDAVELGALRLTAAFTRATYPGAPVAGGFVTITNTGSQDDRLTGGTAAFARDVQVHEMAMQGEVMQMRPKPDGLLIPAGQTVTLKPGGDHLMFLQLNRPLRQGVTETVTLTFQNAGSVDVDMPVLAPAARALN